MSALETQVGGNHYSKLKIQPIEFIIGCRLEFREANAVKYLSRYTDKNGVEDLRKSRHYVEMILENNNAVKGFFRRIYKWVELQLTKPHQSAFDYVMANDFSYHQRHAIMLIANWIFYGEEDLQKALYHIDELIFELIDTDPSLP